MFIANKIQEMSHLCQEIGIRAEWPANTAVTSNCRSILERIARGSPDLSPLVPQGSTIMSDWLDKGCHR